MKKLSDVYQSKEDVDVAELISNSSDLEIIQASDRSLEVLAHVLSFLFEEDSKIAD